MDPEVTITNLEGRYALFSANGAATEEVERYDTQEEAVSGLNAALGNRPATFFIVDRDRRERVYEMTWTGREAADEAPKVAKK